MISLSAFFSMIKFWFSRLPRGCKGKKWPKMSNISVCNTLHFRNQISYDLHLWYTCTCKRVIYPAIFFKILIFEIIKGGGKRAKNDPKWQKDFVCISGTIHHRLYFLVHICKIMISPVNFFIFQNFDFSGFRGIKGKKWPKTTNLSLFCFISQEL